MSTSKLFPWRIWLLAVAFFLAATCLYTRHNTFPYFYHPDEPSKANQLVSGSRNFRHPLLLVNMTDVATRLLGVERTRQNMVVVGRCCSAVFAAVAVSAFALLAYRRRGPAAMICAGLVVMLHFQIFELSHYMKEDTGLLMSLALFFLALDLFWQTPTSGRAAALGVISGLAASAKYVGIILVPIGAVMVAWAGRRDREPKRWRRALLFALGFLAVCVTVNLQGWINPSFWARGLEVEMAAFAPEAYEANKSASWYPFYLLWRLLPWQTQIFAVAYLIFFLRDKNIRTAPGWILILLPFFATAALAITGKDTNRYFLPAIAIINYHCGLGIVEVSQRLLASLGLRSRLLFAACVIAALGLVVRIELRTLQDYVQAFSTDHRQQLLEYVERELPADAVILAEFRTGLGRRENESMRRIQHQVHGASFLRDAGTVDDFRAQGITHLAVSEDNYRRYVRPGRKRPPSSDRTTEERRLFYERLFAEEKLIFETQRKQVNVLNAGLRLYQIGPAQGR